MATQIIGSNVARAFSLVGALSIVRFRTAVASTQDVAFVLAAVVIGMAIGAGHYSIGLAGLVLVAVISFTPNSQATAQSAKPTITKTQRLLLQATLGTEKSWLSALGELTTYCELCSVETVRRGSALLYEYRVVLKSNLDVSEAAHKLSMLPQVESVALKPI